MDPLLDDPIADLLIDDDTDSMCVDVEDSAGPAVVELVGHAFMHGSVNDDVDVVSNFVVGKVFGNVNGSFLPESFAEFIPGLSPVPIAMSHFKSQI